MGGDGGVAVGAGRRRGAVRGDPRGAGRVGFGQAEELAEGHVQMDCGGLPGPGRQPAGDGAAAALLQGVVVALGLGAVVFGAGPGAQAVQHRLDRGGG
jgi:hypothetical protein